MSHYKLPEGEFTPKQLADTFHVTVDDGELHEMKGVVKVVDCLELLGDATFDDGVKFRVVENLITVLHVLDSEAEIKLEDGKIKVTQSKQGLEKTGSDGGGRE